jgi:hypothetical protein
MHLEGFLKFVILLFYICFEFESVPPIQISLGHPAFRGSSSFFESVIFFRRDVYIRNNIWFHILKNVFPL